ncbi:hypothetical protein FB45DRAFT_794436 [Roridomyces roridus]|uniref:Protein-S-isoprenylcysteine O-methyltransferase n=1 Tax=Roridomyces roridus TaxID=1738132 RepID=A0AAD7BRL8_9AGAR|nr:hypothetical protein FB45DRAFT_794436 [Roridomyces roridus]
MSAAKILCIFAATIGLHIASTSPNPPLAEGERKIIPRTKLEFLLGSYQLRVAQTYLYWVLGAIEIAVVTAQVYPASLWSHYTLSVIACGGDPSRVHSSASPTLALGALLIACGAALRLACYQALGTCFTFELGIIQNHKLVTCGPYAIVRHPSYSGAILAYFGMLLYYASPGSWVSECLIGGTTFGVVFGVIYASLMSFVVLGLLGRISKEDQGLRSEFGDAWAEYAAVVRFALVPRVF